MIDDTGPKLTRLVRWAPGDSALATATAGDGSSKRALVALEAFERLAALIAATAEPQSQEARRLAPDAKLGPVAILLAVRSGRIYLAVEPGASIEIECSLANEPGELVVVKGEVRNGGGERVAKAELQYVILPAAGEHLYEAQIRETIRARLLGMGGVWQDGG
jgi:hypothetical protein